MEKQTALIAFLKETINRFGLKSPKFFQVYQMIGLVLTGIGFIPDIITWLDLTPTPIVSKYVSLAVKVAGGIMWLMAKIPVQNATKEIEKFDTDMPFSKQKI